MKRRSQYLSVSLLTVALGACAASSEGESSESGAGAVRASSAAGTPVLTAKLYPGGRPRDASCDLHTMLTLTPLSSGQYKARVDQKLAAGSTCELFVAPLGPRDFTVNGPEQGACGLEYKGVSQTYGKITISDERPTMGGGNGAVLQPVGDDAGASTCVDTTKGNVRVTIEGNSGANDDLMGFAK
jgi:hypothetical protein